MRAGIAPILFFAISSSNLICCAADSVPTPVSDVRPPTELAVAVAPNAQSIDVSRVITREIEFTEESVAPSGKRVTTSVKRSVDETQTNKFALAEISALYLNGSAVPQGDLLARLSKPTPVIFLWHNNPPQPQLLTMFKPDTLMIRLVKRSDGGILPSAAPAPAPTKPQPTRAPAPRK